MNVNDMRAALRSYYGPGSSFSRSLDRKPDNQIIAIYFRLKNKGLIK